MSRRKDNSPTTKKLYFSQVSLFNYLDKRSLAIIPSIEHNSPEYSSVFHDRGSKEPLHDNAFEVKKMIFWKRYLEAYDQANGEFRNIPYLNHKKDRVKGSPPKE